MKQVTCLLAVVLLLCASGLANAQAWTYDTTNTWLHEDQGAKSPMQWRNWVDDVEAACTVLPPSQGSGDSGTGPWFLRLHIYSEVTEYFSGGSNTYYEDLFDQISASPIVSTGDHWIQERANWSPFANVSGLAHAATIFYYAEWIVGWYDAYGIWTNEYVNNQIIGGYYVP